MRRRGSLRRTHLPHPPVAPGEPSQFAEPVMKDPRADTTSTRSTSHPSSCRCHLPSLSTPHAATTPTSVAYANNASANRGVSQQTVASDFRITNPGNSRTGPGRPRKAQAPQCDCGRQLQAIWDGWYSTCLPEIVDGQTYSLCPACGRRLGRTNYWPATSCSPECRRELRNARRRVNRSETTCEVCGDTFTPPRADARYCSGRCRQKAYRQRR